MSSHSNSQSKERENRDIFEGVKVNDKRRYNADGSLRDSAEVALEPEATEHQGQVVDNKQTEKLTLELDALRKRFDELARAYQSVEKDKEEFKARIQRERERMIDVEKGKVALSLIEVVDELDLCVNQDDTSSLATGVRLIRANVAKKLECLGVTTQNLDGLFFDPQLAEATDLEMTLSPDDDQKIVQTLKPGYLLNNKVIRAARVRVAKYVKPVDA